METYLGTVGFGSVNLRQERSLGLRGQCEQVEGIWEQLRLGRGLICAGP